jgi:carbonic anhydrase
VRRWSLFERFSHDKCALRSTTMQTSPLIPNCCSHTTRRGFLKTAGIATAGALLSAGLFPQLAYAAALTKAQRDKLTPDEIIAMMKRGNERFRSGKKSTQDFLAQQRASAKGQYPAAVILSCIDSRASAETIMDLAIGDVFNARVAGNVANDDILGSMEFACAAAGAKVVLVMGHTACGAIKGAIDDVQLGNLTGLLARIQPAVKATANQGDRSAKNNAFVDAVARRNVELTMENIRKGSSVLNDLKAKGTINIVGAMYDIASAKVDFFA